MKLLIVLLALTLSSPGFAGVPEPTAEVDAFIADREACDHFRGEPIEGTSTGQVERREFVEDSIEIFCAGSDRRLAALRRRFKDNPAVVSRLSGFEPTIEPGCERP